MKRKINCLVCDTTYTDNNSNNPNHAIYLGFAEGRKNLVDKPVFIHQQSSCITKARKIGVLDKSGKFVHCIVCGHRVNFSEKILSGGGTIKQNGYLVDTNAWIHRPLPLHDYHPMKKKYEDFVISSCYERAFGHSNFPPDDILSKREGIIKKYSSISSKETTFTSILNQESSTTNLKQKPPESVIENQSKGNMEIDSSVAQHLYAESNKKPGQQFMPQDLFELFVAGVGYLYFLTEKKESLEELTETMWKDYANMIIDDGVKLDVVLTTNKIIDFLTTMKTPEDMMPGFFKRFQDLVENYNPDGTKKSFLKKKVFGGLWFSKSELNPNRIDDCVKRAKSFYVIMRVMK